MSTRPRRNYEDSLSPEDEKTNELIGRRESALNRMRRRVASSVDHLLNDEGSGYED